MAKLLLRLLPAMRAQGDLDIDPGALVFHVLAAPAAVALLYAGMVQVLVTRIGMFPALAEINHLVPILAVASLLVSVLNVLAVFARVALGTFALMLLRDGVQHLVAILTVVALGGFALGDAETVFGVFIALLLAANIGLGMVIARAGPFRFRHSAPGMRLFRSSYWLNGLTGALMSNVDVLAASALLQPEHVGLYVVLRRVANAVSLPQTIANDRYAVPIAAAHAEGDTAAVQRASRDALSITAGVSTVLAIAVVALDGVWLPLFGFGPSGAATTTLAFLTTANLLSVYFGINFMVAAQCGLELRALRARALGLALFGLLVAMIVLLRPAATAWQLALSQMLAMLIMNAVIWAQIRRRLGIDTSIAAMFRRVS